MTTHAALSAVTHMPGGISGWRDAYSGRNHAPLGAGSATGQSFALRRGTIGTEDEKRRRGYETMY
jgi:hypothetical protein